MASGLVNVEAHIGASVCGNVAASCSATSAVSVDGGDAGAIADSKGGQWGACVDAGGVDGVLQFVFLGAAAIAGASAVTAALG